MKANIEHLSDKIFQRFLLIRTTVRERAEYLDSPLAKYWDFEELIMLSNQKVATTSSFTIRA